jgi:hypothetical protein
VVHFFEVLAFFARQAGFASGNTALGYALQSSVFMLTRIFTMALFPLLGFIVDKSVSSSFYLSLVSASLVCASIAGATVIFFRNRVVHSFVQVINAYQKSGGMFLSLVRFPLFFFKKMTVLDSGRLSFRNSFFCGGFIVFGIYSVSVFLSFYFGLIYYEYRATITQLSGVTNALATVILTFYIEPRLSSLIDKDASSASDSLCNLMLGRVIGTLFFGLVFLIFSILTVIEL